MRSRSSPFALAALGFAAQLSVGGNSVAHAGGDETGAWTGIVTQPGVRGFTANLVFDGQGGGTSDYPELDCGGRLEGGPGTYTETITRNRAVAGRHGGCVDGEMIVEVGGEQLKMTWSGAWDGETYTAWGTLKRGGAKPK